MKKLTPYTYGKQNRELNFLIAKAKKQRKKRSHLYQALRELHSRWIEDYYGGFWNMVSRKVFNKKNRDRAIKAITAPNPLMNLLRNK